MQEASQSENKEWKGLLSSMFSSLFWLQENRLTPKNRCTKCNRPKVQTSPFEARCKCSVLACKESSATPSKHDNHEDDSLATKSSINLVYKSSPITSKLSALYDDDSFMKLIIKDSKTKCLPTLHDINHQKSFDDLNIPTCKDSLHICCNLHNEEIVLNTVNNDDDVDNDNDTNDNESNNENDRADESNDSNESTNDSDDKSHEMVESFTQTDIVESDESCNGLTDEEKTSVMSLNDNSKKIIEILGSKSSTCSSCEHGVIEEYTNKTLQESPDTSMKFLSSVEQIKDDILFSSSILSSCCDHNNFSNENCSTQSNSISYSNNSFEKQPCDTPPEELSQPPNSKNSTVVKPSRIPIHISRMRSRRNSSRYVFSTPTNLVSGSTVTKTVNYQQTLFNENKNIPKKINRGSVVLTPPMTTNIYRSFHLPSQSSIEPKKLSQSYYNVTSGSTGCSTCDEKDSKIIKIQENDHLNIKHRSSNSSFKRKQADNTKLIKSIPYYKNKSNYTYVPMNVDKSQYSKYYGSQQNNLNHTMKHPQRKPSICNSLLSTDMDDESLLIIETLVPKDYHVLRHSEKETIINNNTSNNNNSQQSNDRISLRSPKISRTFSIQSSKPSSPIETTKK